GAELRLATLAEEDVTQVPVAGQRVQPGETAELVEALFRQHLLECRQPHLGRLDQPEVMAHEVADALPGLPAPPQPLADGDRDFGGDGRVSVERDAGALAAGAARLGDVV